MNFNLAKENRNIYDKYICISFLLCIIIWYYPFIFLLVCNSQVGNIMELVIGTKNTILFLFFLGFLPSLFLVFLGYGLYRIVDSSPRRWICRLIILLGIGGFGWNFIVTGCMVERMFH